ncbi:MAG: CoA pyrophosphatase [Bacteroidales bacterium]|nr:CoA pyrophosphatase [Bacteroidales bacterium]
MNIRNFTERLNGVLEDLPGVEAHELMAPSTRLRDMNNLRHQTEPVSSSILILLYPHQDRISTVLIQRPNYDGVHGGQIGFPGGKYEQIDRDLMATALRETEEEIGVHPEAIEIIGKLSDLYIPPSNFMVCPFIGFCMEAPKFNIDPHEVDGIITISVDDLFVDEHIQEVSIPHRKYGTLDVPAFVIRNHIIWGATAMMLAEFRAVVERFYQPLPEL